MKRRRMFGASQVKAASICHLHDSVSPASRSGNIRQSAADQQVVTVLRSWTVS